MKIYSPKLAHVYVIQRYLLEEPPFIEKGKKENGVLEASTSYSSPFGISGVKETLPYPIERV